MHLHRHPHTHPHHLHRFANREMMEMFAFQSLRNLAFSLIGIFVPVYLFVSGITLFHIMLLYTTLFSLTAILSYLFSRIIIFKLKIKHTFILTSIFSIIYFWFLHNGIEPSHLIGFLIFAALAGAIYPPAYHSYITLTVDRQREGGEVATVYIIACITQMVAPFIGSFLIIIFGFSYMFLVACIILLISVIPLFLSQEIDLSTQERLSGIKPFKAIYKKDNRLFIALLGRGLDDSGTPLWGLYLYKIVNGLRLFGILVSSMAFLDITGNLIAGRRTDKGKSTFRTGINSDICSRGICFAAAIPEFAILGEIIHSLTSWLYFIPYQAKKYQRTANKHAVSLMVAYHTLYEGARMIGVGLTAVSVYFLEWYGFIFSIFFVIIGKFIIRSQRIGE